jgi:two-component system chemotaxis response regulator CheB
VAPPRNVVVVGASAGGVEALGQFVSALPPDLPAAVLVVLHVAPGGTSVLPGILNRAGPLAAAPVGDGEPLDEGRIYVGVPDRHLVLEDGLVRAPRGPRENGHRPAVDPLFRSAAAAFGPACIAVVLSGARDDGTAGAAAVRAAGGCVMAQDPGDALYPSMPESVIERVGVDQKGTAFGLAGLVAAAIREHERETPMSGGGGNGQGGETLHEAGDPGASGLTCPECGGAIYLDMPEGVVSLNCHTGHAYSPQSFAAEQERAVEVALWSAVRHLEERAAMLRRLAGRVQTRAPGHGRFEAAAIEAQAQAGTIRELIAGRTTEVA